MLPRRGTRQASYCGRMETRPGSTGQSPTDDPTLASLRHQAGQCDGLGSPMYAILFRALADDYASRGRTHALLAGRSARPVHDALPLRLAGSLHRVVLKGDAPRLARHYPSVGGTPGPGFVQDFLDSMLEHAEEVEAGLSGQVQTNEVGRSVVPLVLSHWLTTLGIEEFAHLEVGASAGLNMNFDRYCAASGSFVTGDPSSAVRFTGDWCTGVPAVPAPRAVVIERRGVDVAPIDATDPAQGLRLLSFVWPDQTERMERLRGAVSVAAVHPPLVDRGSADAWLRASLDRVGHVATVVFHSIVWQYLGPETQAGLRGALEDAGARATADAPLVWARMEPAGPLADVRATVWRGGPPTETVLAEIGYHGRGLRWHSR